jgi:hypothetical protein
MLAAGVLAGTAASVKYHGLYFVAAAGALMLFSPGPRARRTLLFAVAALAVMAPTYGRLIAETGNPVFPFFPSVFGENAWSDWGRLLRAEDAGRGPVATAAELFARALRYPGELLLRRGPFWHPPVSPLLMAAGAAGAVFALRRRGAARTFLLLALGYMTVVLLLSPDPRYLLPVAPGVAALGAAAAVRILARWLSARPVRIGLLALLAVLPGIAYVAQLEVRRGAPVLTQQERERYLERRLPHYGAVKALNARHGSGYSLYAFGAESMAYFARGRFRGDHYGPFAFTHVLESARVEGLPETLRRMGATHLLVPTGSPVSDMAAQEGLVEDFRTPACVVYRITGGASP